MFGWHPFRHDPGPCPVDDAPHTTCTSPDYVPGALITVPLRRPRALDETLAALRGPVVEDVAPSPEAEARTFTQQTYRRATHGRRLRGPRGRH